MKEEVLSKTYNETLNFIKMKTNLIDICNFRNLKEDTIINHIDKLYNEGYINKNIYIYYLKEYNTFLENQTLNKYPEIIQLIEKIIFHKNISLDNLKNLSLFYLKYKENITKLDNLNIDI